MTQLLQEMIVLREASLLNEHISLLLEYLGTLSVVDKGLVKSLKNVTNWSNKTNKLGSAIGAKSKVETKVASGRNSDQLWKAYDEDANIVAMIFSYDGSQVMAVSDRNRLGVSDGTNSSETNKAVMFTITSDDFYTKIMPEGEFDEKFAKSSYDNRAGKRVFGKEARDLKTGATKAKTFVRKVLDSMVKKALADSKKVEVMYVYKDAERKIAQRDREAARRGKVPIPSDKKATGRYGHEEYSMYIKGLKDGLRQRLEKFKASKAKGFTSVVEMLEYIKNEGYLDKLKLNGLNYNMKNSNLHLGDMIKKARGAKNDNWISDSYLEYSMDWDERSDVYSKMRKEYREANPDASYEDMQDALEGKLPPATLKVIFKLEGGVIVPSEVKLDQRG